MREWAIPLYRLLTNYPSTNFSHDGVITIIRPIIFFPLEQAGLLASPASSSVKPRDPFTSEPRSGKAFVSFAN